jgi:hypothetical protein
MAEKIMKTENEYKFEGEGLKVGGEGMKGFYDQIIPKALEKIGKEYGVKVKQGETLKYQGKPGYQQGQMKVSTQPAEMQKVPYIDIPQGLKDQAMQKGFPLFSSSYPGMFIPVDHNPHDVSNTPIEPIKGSPNPNLSRSEAAKTK